MNVLINEAARLWWQWMVPMLWQASLLVMIITLIDWVFNKWIWPQVRYAVWLLVLLKLVIPPTLNSPVSLVSWAKPRVEKCLLKVRTDSLAPLKGVSGSGLESAAVEPEQPAGASQASAERTPAAGRTDANRMPEQGISPMAWALIAWIAGMLVFSGLLIMKMARLRRWHRMQKEREIPKWFHALLLHTAGKLGLKQIPAIVFARDAVTPAVYGMFRPVLLLPAGYLDKLSRREAEHVLLHELCHLKRGDLWVHGLYLVLHVVYWFNPFLIWTRRQMKHVREICCDLSVAQVLRGKTKDYRQTLLDSARSLLTETVEPGLGLLGVFEEPFRLVSRLKWLEKESWKHRKWIAAASLFAGIGLAAVMIPMSASELAVSRDDQIAFTLPPGAEPLRTEGPARRIEDTAQNPKTPVPDFEVELKRTESMTAVILPKIGPPTPMLESAMAELKGLLKKQRIKPSGNPFFRIWSDAEKVSESQYAWEVGFPVKADISVKPPLEFIRVSAMQVASARINGVLATEPAWAAFVEKIKNMGLVPAFPPAMEVYGPLDDRQPIWWNTELQMQALRPQTDYSGMDIKIRETAPAVALVLPVQGSYAQFRDKVNRVKEYIREKKISASDRWICLNFSDPSKVKPSEYLWEIGCELEPSENLKVDPPFEIHFYKKDTVASSFFDGPPETEFPVTPFIIQNLMNGHMIAGPMVFSWKEDPHKNNPSVKRTELFMPVEKVEAFAGKMEAWGKAVSQAAEKSWIDSTAQDASGSQDASGKTGKDGASQSRPEPSNGNTSPAKKNWKDKVAGFFKGLSEPGEPERMWTMVKKSAYWAILLPVTGSMEQHPVVFERLQNVMKANGITAAGPPFTRQYYTHEIVPEFEVQWEAGYPIADSTAVQPPFKVVRIPERKLFMVKYTPTLDQKALNVQLASWLYHNNYRPLLPNVLIWTNGIPNTIRELKSADVEIQVAKMDEAYETVRVFTRSETERRELILPMSGSWKQTDAAIGRLKRYVEENRIETLGDVFVQYHNNIEVTPEKDLMWDVGVPIKGDVRTADPFRTEWRHGRLLACAGYEGDRHNLPVSFWLSYELNFTMNGYQVSGYPREVFRKKISGNQWRIELQWPVKQ
jgi:beta-lactamase regulating signal transducer with metallopeptidase domain/effector-binding domain-containing protein